MEYDCLSGGGRLGVVIPTLRGAYLTELLVLFPELKYIYICHQRHASLVQLTLPRVGRTIKVNIFRVFRGSFTNIGDGAKLQEMAPRDDDDEGIRSRDRGNC